MRRRKTHEKRARVVLKIEEVLLRKSAAPKLDEPPPEFKLRGGRGFFQGHDHDDKGADGAGQSAFWPANVGNNGCLSGFDAGKVFWIPSRMDQRGAVPLPIPDGDPETILGLMRAVNSCETLAVPAALNGCYRDALAEIVRHQRCLKFEVGRKVLDETPQALPKAPAAVRPGQASSLQASEVREPDGNQVVSCLKV